MIEAAIIIGCYVLFWLEWPYFIDYLESKSPKPWVPWENDDGSIKRPPQ